MSMYLLHSAQPTNTTPAAQQANRFWWASTLARYTGKRREELGLTLAQATELSGLQISEWLGLEDGWVPEDLATLRAVAGALQVRWADFHMLAFLAKCSQKCR